jgi:hypothetical protein
MNSPWPTSGTQLRLDGQARATRRLFLYSIGLVALSWVDLSMSTEMLVQSPDG